MPTISKNKKPDRRRSGAINPIDHFAFQARFEPDRLALWELASGRRWSFADLDRDIARAATVLRHGHAIAVGDRVATLARNRAELLILQFACARIGAIYVPLNWRLTAPEINSLIVDAEPALLIGDAERDRVGLRGVSLDDLTAQIAAADRLPPEPIDRDRPSLILFTSGTSGRPKGALLSERNLEETGFNLGKLVRVTHDSRFLVDSPMFHILGLVTNIRTPLMHGGAVLISEGFEASRTLARMSDPDLAVTHYFCVPQMTQMLRHVPGFDPATLRHLTAIFTGGAPHPAANIRTWLAEGIPVADGFGMSETGTVFGMPVDLTMIDAKAGSVGVGPPEIGARIVDDEDRDCPVGVAGELLLKGNNVFSGYWRRPEETAKSFTDDGWFRSGDIATCDEDGYYRIVDRKKDMFISGGENVYPAEIEAAVAGYPGVIEMAVIGVPDARWGEVGHLAIVVAAGMAIETEAILAHLGERIARYKIPKHVTMLDALPRTGSGKVQKPVLRAMLLETVQA